MNKVRTAMCLAFAAALLLSLHARADETPPPLVLTQDGAARCSILLPSSPTPLEAFAARELAAYLKKLTGADVPVINEGEPVSTPVVSVGKTSLAANLEMAGESWKRENREAFRILRRNNAVLICGNQEADACDLGTLYGVYAFLETFGIGWYLPDPLGEVVPDTPTATVADLDITDAPVMEMRAGGGMPDDRIIAYEEKEAYPYGIRARAGGGRQVWFSHSHYLVLTPKVLEEHPQYAPNGQYCLSRPEVRQLFVDYHRDYFRSRPDAYASSLFPDDNTGPSCPCPDCERLLQMGKADPITPGWTSKTDLFVDFYNAVAEGLADEFPDRRVIGAAYVSYLAPPEEIRVHPNVIILITPLQDTSETHPSLERIVQGWRDMGARKLYWYGYLMGDEPKPHEIARRFRNYRRWRLDGVYIEHCPTWATSGLNYWIEGRLAWDWNRNVDDLIEEFCTQLFGPKASPHMVAFFNVWEQRNHDRAWDLAVAAEEMVPPDSPQASRIRFFKLGLEMARSEPQMDAAIRADNLSVALEAARRGVAARDAVNSDYGPGLAHKEYDHFGRYVSGLEIMIPVLERAVDFKLPDLGEPSPAVGALLCLTHNADEPADKRLDTGATVSYDLAPNDPADYPAPRRSKLFNGNLDGGWNNVVGYFRSQSGVWNITVDLQAQRRIDRVDIMLHKVPTYVDVAVSTDGEHFVIVDRMFPRGLTGWIRSRNLGLDARCVRLSLVSPLGDHQVNEVKIWGRKPAE